MRILENGKNFMIWCWHFFSIGFFIPRILSPWHKDITSYGRGFDFAVFFHTLAWNFISRCFGAIFRTFFIVVGLLLEVLIFSTTAVCFVGWYAGIAIVIYLFV